MKKILSVLMVVILMGMILAGCSQEKQSEQNVKKDESNDVDSKQEQVTLSITHPWFGGDAHAPFMEWALKDFQDKNPNIVLDINEVPQAQIRQKVRADFMGQVATDIVLWYGGAEAYEYVKEDLLLDITPYLKPKEDEFINGALDNISFNEKIYGLPLCQNFFALYLNTDIYEEYGFDYPETYDQLLEQVVKFKEDGLIPIMLPGKNHGLIQHFFSFIANMTTEAGEFGQASYGEEGHSYSDSGFVKAAEIVAELHENGAFDPNIDGIPMTSVEDMFNQGKGAMYFAGIWRVGSLPQESRDRMHPILFPAVDGYTKVSNVATSQTEMAWVVNASVEEDTAKLQALETFLDYFASKEISQKHVELTDTVVPIQKGVDLSSASHAVIQSAELVGDAELRPFLRYYQSPAQGGATNEMTWNLINGRQSVEENIEILTKIPVNNK